MSEQSKWEREAGIFASFLNAAPDFAGVEVAGWKHNQNDSPDILCCDGAGNKIGVEMTEWLDEHQTRDFARWENLLSAVRVPKEWSIDIYLTPFANNCESKERLVIVEELSQLIAEKISRSQIKKSGLRSFIMSHFDLKSEAPTTARYCDCVAGYNPGSGSPAHFGRRIFQQCRARSRFAQRHRKEDSEQILPRD